MSPASSDSLKQFLCADFDAVNADRKRCPTLARRGICTKEVLLLSMSVLVYSSRRPNIDFPIAVSRLPWRWGMGAGCFIVSPFSVYMRCVGFQAAGQVHFSSIVQVGFRTLPTTSSDELRAFSIGSVSEDVFVETGGTAELRFSYLMIAQFQRYHCARNSTARGDFFFDASPASFKTIFHS